MRIEAFEIEDYKKYTIRGLAKYYLTFDTFRTIHTFSLNEQSKFWSDFLNNFEKWELEANYNLKIVRSYHRKTYKLGFPLQKTGTSELPVIYQHNNYNNIYFIFVNSDFTIDKYIVDYMLDNKMLVCYIELNFEGVKHKAFTTPKNIENWKLKSPSALRKLM